MSESCEKCKYWKEIGKADFEKGTARSEQCRRHSPTFVYVGNSSFKKMLKYRFPISAFNDWCGELKPKAEQKQ